MNPSDKFIPLHWPIESDWTDQVSDFFQKKDFQALLSFVEKEQSEKTIYPVAKDVFNAFRLSSYRKTKVVILGQDPYHGPGQAHGLSFSVLGSQKLPPSLKNIFKELENDLGISNSTGDLTSWARQGVLLLNTVLTVEQSKAHSHKAKGWESFTDHVIRELGQSRRRRVFVLWGKPAEKKSTLIDDHHAVIKSAHPSPLSAHRGFFGSKPFSKTNSALEEFGHGPVNWRL